MYMCVYYIFPKHSFVKPVSEEMVFYNQHRESRVRRMKRHVLSSQLLATGGGHLLT